MPVITGVLVLTWAALIALGLVMVGVIRQVNMLTSEIQRRNSSRDGSLHTYDPVSSPSVAGVDLSTSRPNVLLFLDAHCLGCAALVPAIVQEMASSSARVLVIVPDDASATKYENDFPTAEVVVNRAALPAFGVTTMPSAIVVSSAGLIVASAVAGSPRVIADTFQFVARIERATTEV